MATRKTRDAREVSQWSRVLTIGLPVAVGVIIMLLSQTSAVRAMQDEHATGPHATREFGATEVDGYAGEAKCLTCHTGMNSNLQREWAWLLWIPASRIRSIIPR